MPRKKKPFSRYIDNAKDGAGNYRRVGYETAKDADTKTYWVHEMQDDGKDVVIGQINVHPTAVRGRKKTLWESWLPNGTLVTEGPAGWYDSRWEAMQALAQGYHSTFPEGYTVQETGSAPGSTPAPPEMPPRFRPHPSSVMGTGVEPSPSPHRGSASKDELDAEPITSQTKWKVIYRSWDDVKEEPPRPRRPIKDDPPVMQDCGHFNWRVDDNGNCQACAEGRPPNWSYVKDKPVPKGRRRTKEKEDSLGFQGLCCDPNTGHYIGDHLNDCRRRSDDKRCVVHGG
jgi:hypothetical protein